jgi:hypothetical protein
MLQMNRHQLQVTLKPLQLKKAIIFLLSYFTLQFAFINKHVLVQIDSPECAEREIKFSIIKMHQLDAICSLQAVCLIESSPIESF